MRGQIYADSENFELTEKIFSQNDPQGVGFKPREFKKIFSQPETKRNMTLALDDWNLK